MLLSFERKSTSFKFVLTRESVVHISEESLNYCFSPRVSRELFEFAASFSVFEIPGHILVILLIICLYSRDGILMKQQVRQPE